MAKRLEGKVAIVTGGAKGIGAAICKLFAAEGAKVICADFGEMTYECKNVKYYKLNVTDVSLVSKFYADVVKKYKHIDVLVNNAGIIRDAFTAKMTDEAWDAVINVNLKGVFNLTRLVGPHMVELGSGSIINISSVVGVYGNIGQANYAATKAGVIGLAKTWAKEFSTKRILLVDGTKQTVYTKVRVNAIAPGYVNTDIIKSVPEDVLNKMKSTISLGRLGEPEDVAQAALWLASDESSYTTGHVLHVDGGIKL